MITFQEFMSNLSDIPSFIERALADHASDPMVIAAQIADEYNKQRNRTVLNYAKYLYDMNGQAVIDRTASTNRITSNFFRRLNVQRNTYLLGNGVFFADPATKEKLGTGFDQVMKRVGYNALIHGLTFGLWDKDRLINFKLSEFVPFWNEDTSALSAGIRYWQLTADSPRHVILYEKDGYTEFADDTSKRLRQVSEKHAYKTIINHTDFGGDEIVGFENYTDLPIVPMWGSDTHQSTLIGMRAKIDAYDLIASGFANDLDDCAEIYWLIGNASGMDELDLSEFRDRLKLQHIAKVDRDQTVTPYTQDIPYTARKEFLDMIRANIYEDFGGLDVHTIAAGATNDHIEAAYQPLDEEADDYEYQCTDFIKGILALQGIDDEPVYKRNRISNQTEATQMVLSAAEYLDQETILNKLPFITVDETEEIMKRKSAEELDRMAGFTQAFNEGTDSE